MRTAALSDFRKLWGHIDVDLAAGDQVNIYVTNQWNSYEFKGQKLLARAPPRRRCRRRARRRPLGARARETGC